MLLLVEHPCLKEQGWRLILLRNQEGEEAANAVAFTIVIACNLSDSMDRRFYRHTRGEIHEHAVDEWNIYTVNICYAILIVIIC